MADLILHFQLHTVSHTHSLSLSLRCLALFPILIVWYKNPGIHFQVIIDRNKLFEYTPLFHLEVAYNKKYDWDRLDDQIILGDWLQVCLSKLTPLIKCQSNHARLYLVLNIPKKPTLK